MAHNELHTSSIIRRRFFFILSFLNNLKDLDPSKAGSRSLGMFRKSKTSIIAKFHRTDLVICSFSKKLIDNKYEIYSSDLPLKAY